MTGEETSFLMTEFTRAFFLISTPFLLVYLIVLSFRRITKI